MRWGGDGVATPNPAWGFAPNPTEGDSPSGSLLRFAAVERWVFGDEIDIKQPSLRILSRGRDCMKRRWLFLCCAVCLTLAGCAAKTGRDSELALPMPQSTSAAQGEADKNTAQLIPDRLKRDASGVPMLSVYDIMAE